MLVFQSLETSVANYTGVFYCLFSRIFELLKVNILLLDRKKAKVGNTA